MVVLPSGQGASSSGFDDAPYWRLDEKYRPDFERHLKELLDQLYPETTNPTMTERRQIAGLMGHACFCVTFLGLDPDFRNKPGGDGGVDAVLRLSLPGKDGAREIWMDLDVKTTTHASQELRVAIDWRRGARAPRINPYGIEILRIYVAAYSPYRHPERVRLTGWLFGHDVVARGAIRDMQPNQDNHQAWCVPARRLRPMELLKAWTLNGFHHDDHRLTRWAI